MGDRFEATVSADAIVTITDNDADSFDVIHKDIKRTLGSNLSWDNSIILTGISRWYYSAATTVTTSYADLIGGFGSTTLYANTAVTVDAVNDLIRMIYIEHLGIDGAGNPSAATDYLGMNVANSNNTAYYTLMLEPGESIVLKFMDNGGDPAAGMPIEKLNGDMFANTAQVKVVALCDDTGL